MGHTVLCKQPVQAPSPSSANPADLCPHKSGSQARQQTGSTHGQPPLRTLATRNPMDFHATFWHRCCRQVGTLACALAPVTSLDADAMENSPSWEAAAFGLGKTSKASKEKQNYEVHKCLEGKRKKHPPPHSSEV